ncbi:MAG: cytochrome c3 family protein [Deltaproteobacteria bacterium]|nr:MAG: cytochrome c3 family protein [Deltaproteobacteria bacterium]
MGFISFIRFSTSSYFCGSCHIMKPYYNAWKSSKHDFVPCVDCHYPPGFTEEVRGKIQASTQVVKYLTRTYGTKPYAEIDDASCLRKGCHSKRLLEGKADFKKGIVFDHKPHLTEMRRGRRLRCVTCHSQIVVGTHIAVTETDCFICHFKPEADGSKSPIADCTICHEEPKGDIELSGIVYNHEDFVDRGVECEKCHIDVVQGEGGVPKERCLSCHGELEKLEKFDEHQFIHDHHVTRRKVECAHCHSDIEHRITTRVEFVKTDCLICHSASHRAQEKIYMGTGGKGVEDMPNSMFLARVDCAGCHTIPKNGAPQSQFVGQTKEASEAGCLSCHGKDYLGILDDWKASIEDSLKKLKPKLEKAEKLTKGTLLDHKSYQEANDLYLKAKFNYEFVAYANGAAHNVEYSTALLDQAQEDIEKAITLLSR